MNADGTYWYCPDCGAKGYERGAPNDYDTLHHIGFDHRTGGNKCVGMHIRAGGENVWPGELTAPLGRSEDAAGDSGAVA